MHIHISKTILLVVGLPATLAHADSALDGQWDRPCWRGDLDLSVSESTTFAAESFTVLRRFSAQETCNRADFQFIASGGTRINDSTLITDAFNVDVTWSSSVATTLHEEATRAFNQMEACGFSDWQTNVPKDIGGRECETMRAPALSSQVPNDSAANRVLRRPPHEDGSFGWRFRNYLGRQNIY